MLDADSLKYAMLRGQLVGLQARIVTADRGSLEYLTQAERIATEMHELVTPKLIELAEIKAERARVASGSTVCADCNSILARF